MRTVLAVMAAATAVLGCGSDPAPPVQASELGARERTAVRSYDARIATHCGRISAARVDPAKAPTPEEERDAFAAADALLALAQARPDAIIDPGQDLRLFVSDTLENLEGSNCDPRIQARLSRGLARIARPEG